MLCQKLTNLISICRKAGKMEIGFAPMKEALQTGRVCGVITACDISQKTYKEVCYYCQKHQVPVCAVPLTMEQIGSAIGRKAAVVSILDQGFFDSMHRICDTQQTEQTQVL
jgi:ribosomal protein L7Ae-like RNA K-turn-binding protein